MWTGTGSTGSSVRLTNFAQPRYQPVDDRPLLMGSGPAECSSCTQLSVVPLIIWDVNGYYRELGVDPRATRRQLREAYQAKDGQSSPRLTYILKQLIDPAIRYAYDCTPLGEVFIDRYVNEMVNRRIVDRVSERMQNLRDAGVDLRSIDEDDLKAALEADVVAEMGLGVEDEPDGDTPDETVDGALPEGQDDASPAKFEYSYYLWRARPRQDLCPTDLMVQWQRFLVSALAREGVTLRFAVGLHGDPHRWVQAEVGYRTVFFLNFQEEPTEALASDVARRVRLDREKEWQQQNPRNHREIDL